MDSRRVHQFPEIDSGRFETTISSKNRLSVGLKADDALYSPIFDWRRKCAEIIQWVVTHRDDARNLYRLDRPRPVGALLLQQLLEDYWEHGRREFWRIEEPKIWKFEFDGYVSVATSRLPYPAYSEVGHEYYRSIEDVNLIPNSYTRYYLFANEQDAIQGLTFVGNQFP